jgi:ATP-dependent 26S proteasome regulatory subunit
MSESNSTPPNPIQLLLGDPTVPWEHRFMVLRDLVGNPNPQTEPIVKGILERLSQQTSAARCEEKTKKLEAILKELQEGPMRNATFIETLPGDAGAAPLAFVLLDDGAEAYAVMPKDDLLPQLRRGDRVVLDGKGRVMLRRSASPLKIGEVGHLERRIDDRHVEVTLRAGAERSVYLATQGLMDDLETGEVLPGASLIVSPRRALALAAIPPEDGLSHYRFLDRGPVPEVRVERDIGAPPRCIEDVTCHVRLEMTQPDLRRRYGLNRCCAKLLCGVSGTGKSLAIAAIHRRIYEVMSEVTGVPIDQLPPRVFHIRQEQILSMWLGESEKNWSRAIEEVDGLGRSRGHEAIHDRILTTVLQSLDPGRLELSQRLVILLASTNEPHLVDPAMLRRVGGSIEYFHRLRRRSFMAVLGKLTRNLPAARENGDAEPDQTWERHVQNLTAWLFSPNGTDQAVVELVYAGTTNPVVKSRRDFLTASLVDRAVQQAAAEAAQAELDGAPVSGITLEQLARAFDAQLRGLIDQLKEHNVGSFTDLPDGVRVATLRRLPQPAHLPFEFHRN